MYLKHIYQISIMMIVMVFLSGQVFPQAATDALDTGLVSENTLASGKPIREATSIDFRLADASTPIRTDSILDVPEMAPQDLNRDHLVTDSPTRSKGKGTDPAPATGPETPVRERLDQPAASQPAQRTTDGDRSITEAEAVESTDSDKNEQSMLSDMEDAITEAETDNAVDIGEEDRSVISDEELEFLYQSGSLLEGEIPETSGTDGAGPDQITTPYHIESEELHMLGEVIRPGETKRLRWVASETFYGGMLDTPVHVIHGNRPGLTLCLTAAIHGDELNGVEIVRRLVDGISPDELSGIIIGVPIVNLLGFTRGSRYLPDRRDLNRYFPGNPRGSSASRIANSFIEEVVINCDRLVDLHTGSLNRTNMPQLRANLDNPDVVEFTRHFGSTAVLHSRNIRGNLRTAATNTGIPAVTLELGEPGSLQEKHIEYGVKVIETLLDKLDMVKRRRKWSEPQPVYYSSRWVRVNNGGLLTSTVKVGAKVKQGNTLGIIVNPITSESYKIKSPYNGRVLGKSLNQFMLPGYAAFNIGIVTSETEASLDAQTFECQGTDMSPDLVTDEFDCSTDGNDEAEMPYDERDEMIENIE